MKFTASLANSKQVRAMARAMKSAGLNVTEDLSAGTIVATHPKGELFRAIQKGAGQAWIVRHVSNLFN